jgi:hypothetical protein
MKNAQPHTNVEPSALEQRDITLYRGAVLLLESRLLTSKGRVLSKKAVIKRQIENCLPYCLRPVGDGLHAVFVSINGMIVGIRPPGAKATQENINRCKGFWLPEWAIDRRYLMLGSYLWMDWEALTADSPKERNLMTLRAARSAIGFRIKLRGRYRAADLQLQAELAAKGGAA